MDGLYTETIVKRKTTGKDIVLKYAAIAGSVIIFLAGLVLGQSILMFAGMIAIALVIWVLVPRFNVEFEYVFCDGQIDFDKITAGEKRKTVLRIDLDNVEIMAPERSHSLDSYRNRKAEVKDFSSKDPEALRYCAYAGVQGKNLFIIFEPSEKMVDFARQKAPRKVFTY